MVKLAYIIVGGWIAITGLFFIFGRHVEYRGVSLDFGGGNIVVGLIFLIIGLGILITSFRIKAKDFEDKVLICVSCRTPFKRNELDSDKCPECGGDFDDLAGFYKKHPELNENRK